MKNDFKTTLAVIFTLAITLSTQIGKGQCLDPVKKYINKSVHTTEPKEGQTYFMQFTVKSIPRKNSAYEISTLSSKIYRSKGKMFYETRDINIYQDESEAFMVVHPLKRIIWGKELDKVQEQTSKIEEIQNLLLSDSEVIYCTSRVAENKHDILNIKLKTNEKIREEFKVDFSLMAFDLTMAQLLKVETIFGEDQPLERQIIEYQHVDYNYKGRKLKSARSMVFNTKGELKPEFQQYTLIEN